MAKNRYEKKGPEETGDIRQKPYVAYNVTKYHCLELGMAVSGCLYSGSGEICSYLLDTASFVNNNMAKGILATELSVTFRIICWEYHC